MRRRRLNHKDVILTEPGKPIEVIKPLLTDGAIVAPPDGPKFPPKNTRYEVVSS